MKNNLIPTAIPANTGKAGEFYFERQSPGAADLHVKIATSNI